MGKFKNLVGERFGRLVVIKRSKNQFRNTIWNCLCDCGNFTNVNVSNLRSGRAKSCGCLLKEVNSNHFKTHGMTRTHFYRIWSDMQTRANNPKYKEYYLYGGRGIKIEWREFGTFLKDMYKSYLLHVKKYKQSNTTIERINVNGNYSKKNCKFVTKIEQAKNKRNTKYIILNGVKKTVSDWARYTNIPHRTLHNRINKGLPPELILKK